MTVSSLFEIYFLFKATYCNVLNWFALLTETKMIKMRSLAAAIIRMNCSLNLGRLVALAMIS